MDAYDTELIARWRANRDADAFTELALRHAGMVYATCLRILRDATVAEDVAQECFLELASGRSRVRASVGGFLHALATHRALDRLRADRRRLERERAYAASMPTATERGWDDVLALVDEAIAALPESQRHAIVAHYLEGRSYESVAAETGSAATTIASRARAGLETIRRQLWRKGAIAPMAVAAVLEHAAQANAAPPSLISSLGKLSIAGSGSVSGLGLTIAGGTLMLKKTAVGAGVLVLIALAIFTFNDRGTDDTASSEMSGIVPRVNEATTPPPDSQDLPAAHDIAKPLVAPAIEPIPAGNNQLDVYVSDRDGHAVAGATVVLELMDPDVSGTTHFLREARADADGATRFIGLPFGRFVASARHGTLSGWTPATLREAFPTGSVDVILKPAGVIEGNVVTEAGGAIPGARLRLYASSDNRVELRSAIADSLGAFEFTDVPTGLYRVLVTAEDYAPTFAPETNVDGPRMTLVLGPGATVEGRVWLAGSRTPVSDVAMDIAVEDIPGAEWKVTSDREGRFRLMHLPDGVAILTMNDRNYALVPPQLAREFRAHDRVFVDLYVQNGAQISGQVVDSTTGVPVAGCMIQATPVPHAGRVWRSELTDTEGRYTIAGLSPGDYTLRLAFVPQPLTAFVERETMATVLPGDMLDQIDFEVRSGLVLCGLVVDDRNNPVAGASVSLGRYLPGKHEPFDYSRTHTDSSGSFCFSDVRQSWIPGIPSATEPIVLEAAYRGMRSAESGPIMPEEVSSGIILQLSKVGTGSIAGVVVTEDGAPAVAMYSLRQPTVAPGFDRRMGRTDPDGHFLFQDLAPGDYEIWISPDTGTGYPSRREVAHTLTLGANERVTGLRLVLRPGGEITGRLTDARGTPIRGVNIEAYEIGSETDRDVSSAFTDRDGRFRILNLVGDEFELWPRAGDAGPEWTVTAHAGEYVEIVLPDEVLRDHYEAGERLPIRPDEVREEEEN